MDRLDCLLGLRLPVESAGDATRNVRTPHASDTPRYSIAESVNAAANAEQRLLH